MLSSEGVDCKEMNSLLDWFYSSILEHEIECGFVGFVSELLKGSLSHERVPSRELRRKQNSFHRYSHFGPCLLALNDLEILARDQICRPQQYFVFPAFALD